MSAGSQAMDKAIQHSRDVEKIAKMLASCDTVAWNALGKLYPDKQLAFRNAAQSLIFNFHNIREEVVKILNRR